MTYTIEVANNFKGSGKFVEVNGDKLDINGSKSYHLTTGDSLTINAEFDNPQSKKGEYWVNISEWLADAGCFKANGVPIEEPFKGRYIIKELQKTGTPVWRVEIVCTADLCTSNSKKGAEEQTNTDSGSGNVTVGDDQ